MRKEVPLDIDFVISWVDGSDPAWLKEMQSYRKEMNVDVTESNSNASCRYDGDGEMLRYWFRSVERFAPWVRQIHFVTCGQKPDWLDNNHPKLNLVNHKDFIPKPYLPTFNARTINLNIHRIPGLSEHFVNWDDDIFLLQPIAPEFYFRGKEPVMIADLRYFRYICLSNWSRALFNDYCLLLHSFNFRQSIWQHRNKWFDIAALGWKRCRQNLLCYLANKTIPVHPYGHLAHPILKSVMEEIWERWPGPLHATCMSKFRSDIQVSLWLICAWQQAKGRFFPAHERSLGQFIGISPKTLGCARDLIVNQSVPQVCLNESEEYVDPEVSRQVLLEAFGTILPDKSSFEKD
ncbi:MAG: Stealth CR1 domain-containing protein [Bacteroidales bacterium]|nr:Stealth CR1 domain-containing protein [Bacteroidales bacterium]